MTAIASPTLAVNLITAALENVTGTAWIASPAYEGETQRFFLKETGTNLSLWLCFGGYGNEGRIKISYHRVHGRSGVYHSLWSKAPGGGQIFDPSMTVAQDKTAEKIAKDIGRRLLPEARVVHTFALERIAAEEAYEDNKANLAKTISKIVGVPAKNVGDGKNPSVDPYEGLHERGDLRLGYGSFTISSDSVEFKLTSVPAALAIKLAAVITETIKAHAAAK